MTTVAIETQAEIPGVRFADQVADRATPAAGYIVLYSKNGAMYLRNSAGTVSQVGGGVSDHGALTGLGDDDHTQYTILSPTTTTRNLITVATASAKALVLKTSDDNATNPLLEGQSSTGVMSAQLAANGDLSLIRVGQARGVKFVGYGGAGGRLIVTNTGTSHRTSVHAMPTGANTVGQLGAANASDFDNFGLAALQCRSEYALLTLTNNGTPATSIYKFGVELDGANGISGERFDIGVNAFFVTGSPTLLFSAQLASPQAFITSADPTYVTMQLKGAASQSANRLEIYDSASALHLAVGPGNSPNAVLQLMDKRVLAAGLTDGYTGGAQLDPRYDAAFTVTRHNYLNMLNPTLTNSAVVTDAAVMRFDAAAGTHKAVDGNTTKATPGGVDAWVKVNINGTLYYVPAYLSKTA